MRYILTLTIGLLAVLGASATTATAHDYHRSHHAVEAKHSQVHYMAKRRFHYRIHDRARSRHRARRIAYRRQSWSGNRSRFAIVLSHGGLVRIARRYH